MTVSNEYTITNLPAPVLIEVYSGDPFLQDFYIYENDQLATLTGSYFEFVVADNRGNLLLTLESPASGITIVGAGHVQVEISEGEMEDLPTNCNLNYELRWTPANAVDKTLFAHIMRVNARKVAK